MRFLVDESTGPDVAEWLRHQGHEVFSVYDESRGMEDDDVIRKAFVETLILVTNERISEKKSIENDAHIGV